MNGKLNEAPSEVETDESSQVAWAREVADRELLSFKRLTPKAIENLNRNQYAKIL